MSKYSRDQRLPLQRLLITAIAALLPTLLFAWDQIYTINAIPPPDNISYDERLTEKYLERYTIKTIDHPSFKVIHSMLIAYDKDHLYLKDSIIEGADPTTIRLIGRDDSGSGNLYLRDKSNIYINNNRLNGADPDTFEILQDGLTRDANHLYFNGTIINGADPQSYRLLRPKLYDYVASNPNYGIDKRAVYYDYYPLEEVDSTNFRVFENDDFATDGKALYLNGELVPDIDAENLRFLNDRFIINAHHVYFYRMGVINEIAEADPATFEAINDHYAQDKKYLYSLNFDRYTIISGVTPQSLHFFDGSRFFKDNQHVYLRLSSFNHGNRDRSTLPKARDYDYQHIRIDNADPETFEIVGGEYAKDKSHIYADLGSYYAIMSFDYDSFEYIGLGFVRDREHLYGGIYYNFEIIAQVDPKEAHLIEVDHYPIAIKAGELCFDLYEEIDCPTDPPIITNISNNNNNDSNEKAISGADDNE